MKSLYDYPQAYDAVMHRPQEVVETEVRSVLALLARHGIVRGKILELACGACAHGIPLARQGYQVTGIDRSARMLAEAQRRARAACLGLHTVEGDVVDFELGATGFDAAIFMFETFPLITEYDDIASHFGAVRRHLRRGGVYVIDLDAPKHGILMETGEWGRRIVPLPDGYVETWNEDLPGDWVQGTNHMVLRCRISLGDEVHETTDDWHIRAYSPWELALLTRALDGWEVDGFYSWRDLSPEIAREAHYFAVFVAS
jgi:SAM-dependent methyltransferase